MKSLLRFFYFSISLILTGCFNTHDKELHLIADNYIGQVCGIFNQENGLPKEYDEEGRRVYRISSEGVLKTQFTPNPGGFFIKDREFYYVDSFGQRKIDWFTAIHPKYRDAEKSIKAYPNEICAYGIMLNNGKRIVDSSHFIEFALITYYIDTLKNLSSDALNDKCIPDGPRSSFQN